MGVFWFSFVCVCVRCSHAAGRFVFVSWLLNLKREREPASAPCQMPNGKCARKRNPRWGLASAGFWRAHHYTEQIVHFQTSGCYPITPTHKKTLGEKGQTKKKKKKRDDKQKMQKEAAHWRCAEPRKERNTTTHKEVPTNDEARTHDLSLTLSWRFT